MIELLIGYFLGRGSRRCIPAREPEDIAADQVVAARLLAAFLMMLVLFVGLTALL